MATEIPEHFARQIMVQAIAEARCAEVLECLFDGGSVTIDQQTGRIVLATAAMLASLGVDDDGETPYQPNTKPCEVCNDGTVHETMGQAMAAHR